MWMIVLPAMDFHSIIKVNVFLNLFSFVSFSISVQYKR